jgi:hypothetical protein
MSSDDDVKAAINSAWPVDEETAQGIQDDDVKAAIDRAWVITIDWRDDDE